MIYINNGSIIILALNVNSQAHGLFTVADVSVQVDNTHKGDSDSEVKYVLIINLS